jgi:fibronectin-binding autotransporter adhesin
VTSTGAVANTFSANISLTKTDASRTFTVTAAAGNTLNITGVIKEYSALTGTPVVFNGAGTVNLTNTNTYVGTTTVSNGTLALGHLTDTLSGSTAVTVDGASAILSIAGNSDTVGAVTLKNGASITGTGGTLTGSSYAVESGSISAKLGGSGALIKTTTGTVTLSGANTYSGGTTVSNGTLVLDYSGLATQQLNIRTNNVASTGTLTLHNTNLQVDGQFLNVGSISGAGVINKTGAGYLGMYNGNPAAISVKDFTGQINVQQGAFANNSTDWSTSAGLMSLNVSSGAYFDLRTGTAKIDKLTGSGTIGTTYSQTTPLLVVGNNNGTSTFSGVIQDTITGSSFTNIAAGGKVNLTKAGTGTLTLTGINTYTGNTTVNGGRLIVSRSDGANGATVNLANSGTISIASGTTFELNYTGAAYLGLGNVTLSGTGTIQKTGAGFAGFGNSAAGNVNVNLGAGALIDVQGGTFANGWFHGNWSNNQASLNVAAGASFCLQANDVIVDAVTGSGTIQDGYGSNTYSNTLTIGIANGSGTFGGVIQNGGGSSVLTLVKTGTGTQILGGTNTYSGTTTVSAGTLLINGSLGNTAVSVTNGASLVNNGSIGGTVTTGASGMVSGTGTFSGAVTINGTLAPGNSPGYQSYASDLTLGSASTTMMELSGLSRSDLTHSGSSYYDAVDVGGTLTLDGTVQVVWHNSFTASLGNSFNLFDWGAVNASGFNVSSDLVLPALDGGLTWDTSAFTTNGTITVIPEPAAALLGGFGLLVLLRRRR